MKKQFTIAAALLLCCSAVLAAAPKPPAAGARETDWSEYVAAVWNQEPGVGCRCEHRLSDNSRVDIAVEEVTYAGERTAAWEVERAAKWKEAIGQAVFYRDEGEMDEGGVVLLELGTTEEERATDALYEKRCRRACYAAGLALVVVDASGHLRRVPRWAMNQDN